jgi:hypothetical protein
MDDHHSPSPHGADQAEPRSVFEATMRYAVQALETLNHSHARPDEEALTSAFIGCVLSNFRWCVAILGERLGPGLTCEWAQYSKWGSGQDSESRKGADFALVVKMPNDMVRVAIFQAKSDKSESVAPGTIKLHYTLKPDASTGKPRTQLGVLVQHGTDLCIRMGQRLADFRNLTFVHYLAQLENGLRCVQVAQLDRQVALAIEGHAVPNYQVPATAVSFMEVLWDVETPQPRYWTDVSVAVANAVLPELLELMDFYVGDDGRGGWIELGQAHKVALVTVNVPSVAPVQQAQATAGAQHAVAALQAQSTRRSSRRP